MTPTPYVHGRSDREADRLSYQASRLADLLHHGTRYPPGSRVLEAACGVGAQTVILAQNSPDASFVSMDISAQSLKQAKQRLREEGYFNVEFHLADASSLPYKPETFDHVFVCFLLEHLPHPLQALQQLKTVIRPGGTITVIEGDHGSAFFYPDSPDAHRVIRCLIELQKRAGGNALIGRELWHLISGAGFFPVTISPRTVYADASRPEYGEGVKKIFIAMVEGIKDEALRQGLLEEDTWNRGIRDLYRTTEGGGTFTYTFFKAIGVKKE